MFPTYPIMTALPAGKGPLRPKKGGLRNRRIQKPGRSQARSSLHARDSWFGRTDGGVGVRLARRPIVWGALFFNAGSPRRRGRRQGRSQARESFWNTLIESLRRRPGQSLSELRRLLGVSWGRIQYHLGLMRRAGLIREVAHGRERRVFPAATNESSASTLYLLRRGRVLDMVLLVSSRPGVRQWELTERLGIPRKTLRRYVELLTAQGLLVEERKGRERHYYPGARTWQALADAGVKPGEGSDREPANR